MEKIQKQIAFSDAPVLGEQIQIAPFSIINLLKFQITQTVGGHSILEFYGVVSHEEASKYRTLSTKHLPITVNKKDDADNLISFYKGILTNLKIIEDGGVFYLECQAASYSQLLDIKKKKRSFQVIKNSYETVISEILQEYDGASFLDLLSKGKPVNQFLTQYEETDWEFICRLASHFDSYPLSTDLYDEIRFYFGMPNTGVSGSLSSTKYEIKKNEAEYADLSTNSKIQYNEQSFIEYYVESYQYYFVGDQVQFLGNSLSIISAERILERGVVNNKYRLRLSLGKRVNKYYNLRLRGNSLEGTVSAVKSDKVLVNLDIDKANYAYYWFPYSTSYTSDDNIGWYMMPEVGEKVRIHFPESDEGKAFATSTVRTDSDASLDPSVKTLKNAHGKTITLEPERITIVGSGVEIILKDNESIKITSSANVDISAGGNINMNGSNVLIDGGSGVVLSSQGNSVSVSSTIAVSGSEIKLN